MFLSIILIIGVNLILQTAKELQIDETLLARTRMLMMELQNLMLAVTLAKTNILRGNNAQ